MVSFFKYLRNVSIEGDLNKPNIEFTADGDLKSAELKIMNLRPSANNKNLVWEEVCEALCMIPFLHNNHSNHLTLTYVFSLALTLHSLYPQSTIHGFLSFTFHIPHETLLYNCSSSSLGSYSMTITRSDWRLEIVGDTEA